MSAAHVNTIASQTPEFGVAFACRALSDMPNAGAGEAFHTAANALAERCLR